jgi:heme/copper-type cytochrome/quinol oxidase subunit 2
VICRTTAALCAALLLSACRSDPQAVAPENPPSASSPSAAASPSASPSPEPSESGKVIELTYAGGKVSGDTGRVEVPLGETVLLRVTSDVVEQVHVHGVEEYVDLPAGQTTEASFVAEIAGVFEVELHAAGTLLTRLQVQ